MIFKIFLPKNLAKILAFLLKLLLVFAKHLIITLVFEKNANFFAEDWQKSQKIVIITSTPGSQKFCRIGLFGFENIPSGIPGLELCMTVLRILIN
jgi:hypothetical protein